MRKFLLLSAILSGLAFGSRYELKEEVYESPPLKEQGSLQERREVKLEERPQASLSFQSAGVPLATALSQLFPGYSVEFESGVDPQSKVVAVFYSVSPERACQLIARSVDYSCEMEGKVIRIRAYETAFIGIPDAIEEIEFTSSISAGETATVSGGQAQGGGARIGTGEKMEVKGSISRKAFEETLKGFISDEGHLSIDWSSRTVFVKDKPSRVELVRNFLERHKQVLNKSVYLEARLFFFITNESIETGVNWDFIQNSVRGILTANITGPVFSLRYMGNRVEALIQLLSQRGKVEEIISPRIRTTNLVPAQIVRGTRVPFVSFDTITTTGGGGSSVQTNARIDYAFDGVSLFVRPYVDGDRIYLFLKPLVSRVDGFLNFADGQGNVIRVPQVSYTSQLTRIELGDDQTVVMGGLVWDGKQKQVTGIPLLDQIPLLGRLFSSQRDEKRKVYVILAIYGKVEE
ncbi:MAG: hypothetical protein QW251_00905 [Desulfurococcaceae archaeon]